MNDAQSIENTNAGDTDRAYYLQGFLMKSAKTRAGDISDKIQ